MTKTYDINNKQCSLHISITTNKPNKFLVCASDMKPNSFYAMRTIDVDKSRTIHINFPVSPKKVKIDVRSIKDVEGTQFLVGIKEKPLTTYDIFMDGNTKEFLKLAAQRHLVFNYKAIADFYAASEKQVQELMENSALVIIDFDKAIELGYIELSKEIVKSYKADYNE